MSHLSLQCSESPSDSHLLEDSPTIGRAIVNYPSHDTNLPPSSLSIPFPSARLVRLFSFFPFLSFVKCFFSLISLSLHIDHLCPSLLVASCCVVSGNTAENSSS
ncbi:hypothetical protein F4811DRAFT_296028 [Daldinia bambusicola]|nr:hypothetical protein F4811DRAFT_296028 [Daldinia bambusicola]